MPNQPMLFDCPNIRSFRLNKTACAKLYLKAGYQNTTMQALASTSMRKNCEIGKKNYALLERKKKETKVCSFYEVNPEECSRKGTQGLFSQGAIQSNTSWAHQKFCSSACRVKYNKIKREEWDK